MINWLNIQNCISDEILNSCSASLMMKHLGAGASMWKWAHNGDTVDVCIMCTEAKARAFRPEDNELEDDTNVY